MDISHTSKPYYRQIKDALRARIDSGDLKGGAAIPDERTLAKDLGLSRMTVRRAIVELAREGLLQRVRGKGTFVRDSIRAPRRARKSTLAVIYGNDLASGQALDLFYYRLLTGISLGCQKFRMLTSYHTPAGSAEAFVAELRKDRGLRGAVAVGLADQKLLGELRNLLIPVVLLDSVQPAEGVVFDEVVHEDEAAVFEAVSSLLRLGHRDIGILQSQSLNGINIQRFNGYERALKAFGLSVRPDRVYPVLVKSQTAYESMRAMLDGGDVPTAIFCSGDHLAVGAMAAIADHGWRIPNDISVVGFGDEGYFTSPGLSTVRVQMEQLGMHAVRVLAERIKKPSAPLKRVALPSEWINRASCHEPRASTQPS